MKCACYEILKNHSVSETDTGYYMLNLGGKKHWVSSSNKESLEAAMEIFDTFKAVLDEYDSLHANLEALEDENSELKSKLEQSETMDEVYDLNIILTVE